MRGAALACVLALAACSEPPPAEAPVPITGATQGDGVSVRVGGRDVAVRCALACPATETELGRLSHDCETSPMSGPHRVSTGGPVLSIACCQEAALAYDRACGQEALGGCVQSWSARCEGVGAPALPSLEDLGAATGQRSLGH
ncbi:MAG: hypothetical protein U0234_18655 [Sandaracinus sp.]